MKCRKIVNLIRRVCAKIKDKYIYNGRRYIVSYQGYERGHSGWLYRFLVKDKLAGKSYLVKVKAHDCSPVLIFER